MEVEKKNEKMDVNIPIWYKLWYGNKKNIIGDFFDMTIFNIFKKEFMEWEEYKKKVEKIDEENFRKGLVKEE